MSSGVTHWIGLLKAGDVAAAQPLWDRYFSRLVQLARSRLRGARRRVADEEDVALSAFDSFCRGVAAGRFPQLLDSTDLWKLLVVITARKAHDLLLHERRQKRDGLAAAAGRVEAEVDLDAVIGDEPTPELAALVAEEYEQRLASLEDPTLRAVAQWKLEGFTNQEIKDKLGCSLATVERKLGLIRRRWKRQAG